MSPHRLNQWKRKESSLFGRMPTNIKVIMEIEKLPSDKPSQWQLIQVGIIKEH